MADEKPQKKSTNPLVFVGIGCLVLLVLLGLGGAAVMKFFAGRIGKGVVEKAIETKTGTKVDLSGLDDGKMTFTDSKTGTKVDIGGNTVPDSFPKDFPIYPGANVTSSASNTGEDKKDGFWLTLTTADSPDKVNEYYKDELSKNGWTIESTFTANGMTSQAVKKGTISGSLSTGKTSTDAETQIVIVLGASEE